ncbi:hypothetical protein AMECASPLE_011397 [Ameca splendens]|uniref:Uncharacterized protein n=1 Tax=Ameca splendens TaxID=208324 RepID=A0ABV0XPR3_9TELE
MRRLENVLILRRSTEGETEHDDKFLEASREAEYAGVCTLLIRIPAFPPPNFHHELHGSKCIATWTRHLCGTGLGVLLLE